MVSSLWETVSDKSLICELDEHGAVSKFNLYEPKSVKTCRGEICFEYRKYLYDDSVEACLLVPVITSLQTVRDLSNHD